LTYFFLNLSQTIVDLTKRNLKIATMAHDATDLRHTRVKW